SIRQDVYILHTSRGDQQQPANRRTQGVRAQRADLREYVYDQGPRFRGGGAVGRRDKSDCVHRGQQGGNQGAGEVQRGVRTSGEEAGQLNPVLGYVVWPILVVALSRRRITCSLTPLTDAAGLRMQTCRLTSRSKKPRNAARC